MPRLEPQPISEEFLCVNGCRIRYLTGGAGPPLVLLHGLLGYSFCFRHNLEELARCTTVYALDLPGTGFSERPASVNGTIKSLASTVLDFIRGVGLRRPLLLGSSHGGAVALMAASLAADQKVQTGPMVLVAPVNPWSNYGRRRVKALGSKAGRGALRVLAPFLGPVHGYFLRRMYGDPARLSREAIAGYSAAIRERGTMAHLLGRIQYWEEDLDLLEQALPSCAAAPTLIIWGERDLAVDPKSAEQLLSRLPRAELAIIPGAGHLPFEETPEEFNRLVINFLARQGIGIYS